MEKELIAVLFIYNLFLASETYDKYMLHSISCMSENGGRCNQFHAFSNANLRRRKRGDTAEKELLEERNLAERETGNT